MAKPSQSDMRMSLEDARFFYQQLDPIIRGQEQGQDLVLIRRYFRAYLHCWKCIPHFVREVKGLSGGRHNAAWIAWCKSWESRLSQEDSDVFECLRNTRDRDTHEGTIDVMRELAAGLFPIVMFHPGRGPDRRWELNWCCARGLIVADHLIREHPNIP